MTNLMTNKMADKNKVVFDSHSYTPDRSTTGNADVEAFGSAPNIDTVLKQTENQVKAEEKDGFGQSFAKWLALGIDNAGMMIGNTGYVAGEQFTDPGAGIGIPFARTELMDVLEFLDMILPRQAGGLSVMESLGYTRPSNPVDTFAKKVATLWNDTSTADVDAANKLNDDIYAQQRKERPLHLSENNPLTYVSKFLNSTQDVLDANDDGKASNWFSKMSYNLAENSRKRLAEIGPINTESELANYLLNGSSSLAGSILGAVSTGSFMGKLGSAALESKLLTSSAGVAKLSEKLLTGTMAAVQTAGESSQIARDTYLQSKDEQIRSIGGAEYDAGEDQFIKQMIADSKKANPDIQLDQNTINQLTTQGKEKYQGEWLAQQNQQTRDQIEKNAMTAYHTAISLNTMNMLFEPIQSAFFIKGSLRGESILKKPTRWEFKAAAKAGLSEYAEEDVNTIAQEAGVAKGNDKDYSFHNAANYVASVRGFEDGAWGYIGGHTQAMFASAMNYKERQRDYNAQQTVIAEQNKIGNADQNTIGQFTNLDTSWKGTLNSVRRINDMTEKGDFEGAKMESQRLLRYQAEQAFVTGTTQNLIDNYQKIVDNDQFSDQARKQAKDAISRITQMETIYNKSQKYLNSKEVYYNRTDAKNLTETLQDWTLQYQTKYGAVSTDIAADDKLWQKVAAQIKQLSVDGKLDLAGFNTSILDTEKFEDVNFDDPLFLHATQHLDEVQQLRLQKGIDGLKDAIYKNNREYEKLISKKTQQSVYRINRFYENMAKFEQENIKSNNQFNKYESQQYDDKFIKGLNQLKGKINDEEFRGIQDNYENNKKRYSELKKLKEELIAKQAAEQTAKEKTNQVNPQVKEDENPLYTSETEEGKVISEFDGAVNQISNVHKTQVTSDSDNKDTLAELGKIQKQSEVDPRTLTVDDSVNALYGDMFSNDPRKVSDNLSNEAKADIANAVRGLYITLKKENPNSEVTFEKMLTEFISRRSLAEADEMYNVLAKGWIYAQLPNFATINFENVYSTLIGNPDSFGTFKSSTIGYILSEEEEKQVDESINEKQEEATQLQNNAPKSVDKNGNVYVEPIGDILNNNNTTISYTSIPNQEVNTRSGDIITSKHEATSSELNQNPFSLGSLKLLHPDLFGVGTKLTATIHPDYMNVPVNMYDVHGQVQSSVPFGEWLSAKNNERALTGLPLLNEKSPEYIAKVPMAYIDADGDVIGFVADTDRVSPFHNTEATIQKYKESTLAVRNAVSNNGTASVMVSSKSLGHLNDLKLPYDGIKLLKDADPTSIIAIVKSPTNFFFGVGRETIDNSQIVNLDSLSDILSQTIERNVGGQKSISKKIQSGAPIEFRKVGVDENGKAKYFGFLTVQSATLNDTAINTVYWAINTYLNKNKKEGADHGKIRTIIDSLKKFNIDFDSSKNIVDLAKLLKMFVYTHDAMAIGESNEDKIKNIVFNIQLRTLKDASTPFLFTQGGKIVIGTAYGFDSTNKDSVASANAQTRATLVSSDNPLFLEKLKPHLAKLRANLSVEGLNHAGQVPTINADGTLGSGYSNYIDYARNTLRTSNDARKVTNTVNGVEKTSYVSFVQPTIEVQLTENVGKTTEEIDQQHKLLQQQQEAAAQKEKEAGLQEKNKEVPETELIEFNGIMMTKEQIDAEIARMLGDVEGTVKTNDNDFISHDPKKLTPEQIEDVKKNSQLVKGVDRTFHKQLVDYIFNNIAKFLNEGKINITEAKAKVLEDFHNQYGNARARDFESRLPNLEAVLKAYPNDKVQKLIDEYKATIELNKIISENWSKFEADAMIMINKYLGIKEDVVTNLEDENTDEDEELATVESDGEHNFSKLSFEINGKQSVTAELKLLCQSIEALNANGETVKGVFGVPTYVGFDSIFNNVSAWLAESEADFDKMKTILEGYAQTHTWVPSLITKIEQSGQSMKNMFVSAMNKHALDMEFVMMSKDRTGRYSLKIYSTNSGSITRSLITDWRNNIKLSGLIIGDAEGKYIFNTTMIDKVLDEYEELKGNASYPVMPREHAMIISRVINRYISDNKITKENFFERIFNTKNSSTSRTLTITGEEGKKLQQDLNGSKFRFKNNNEVYTIRYSKDNEFVIEKYNTPKVDTQKVADWLAHFGIEISPETAHEIVYKGFRYDSKNLIKWESQWDGERDGKGTSLLGTLAGTLRQIKNSITVNPENIYYDEEGTDGSKLLNQSIINSLAHMESRHTNHRVVQSFYDNHKSIYGFTATKYITDRIRQLKMNPDSNPVLNQLQSISFHQNSFWLDLLRDNPEFRDDFKVIHLGLTAIKELGKPLYRDNSLHQLSDIDHELTKLGFFMNPDQGDVKVSQFKYGYLKFRMARMFSPTMSDKSIMTLIKTAVLNIDKTVIDNHYDALLEFAYSQMVSPEMKRIAKWKPTNIDAYDKGAVMFLLMPALNNLKVKFNGEEVSLTALLKNMNSVEDVENLAVVFNDTQMTVKEAIKQELDGHIKNEQEQKLKEWEESKFITVSDGKITSFSFLDKSYINDKHKGRGAATIDENVRIAALDYTLNSMIANANSFMAVAGDPAMCYKKEPSTANDDYVKIAKDTLVNVGKRLADEIAPRNKIADADKANSTYLQLMLDDTYRVSDRIKYITKVLDGKEVSQQELEDINNLLNTVGKRAVKEKYEEKYPNSIDYFIIESTNAQEFTTWREHLYVLEKMGKLPDAVIDITQEEIDQAREIFSGERTWEQLNDAQKKLVTKVLQPMKPVYTGQIYDAEQDVMRKVYIKTSSYPLIPQLTAGMEIDKLAKAMEKLEAEKGKTVRASFASGNKVGALKNPLKVSDAQGNFNEFGDLTPYTLELPRANFGIQQNVPLKSYIKDEDVISMGTQITKLLFGNGVMKLDGFTINGQTVNGTQLQQMYVDTFSKMISTTKNDLYNELGINPITGQMNPRVTLKKLERILKNEAILRGYPKQDIEALGIDPKTGTFNLPLWLSPNANRYEALLTAIITHRIVKVKFPGYSYVAGSQTGYKWQKGLQGVEQSNIVFTDHWTGELKGNQVIMPSKLRIDGKLVNLIEDGYAKKVIREVTNRILPDAAIKYLKSKQNSDGTITVYRGVQGTGEQGTGQFWTTDKKVAEYYKDRFGIKNGTIQERSISFQTAVNHFMGQEGNEGFAKDSDIFSLPDKIEGKEVWMLDTDKVSEDLLKDITSFRIPSSKHSSIEQFEIAGFLPTNSADLIIVSQDGTVAMGEDYDVDKRYTYHYWTTVEDGKIVPLHRSKKYTQNSIDDLIEKKEKLLGKYKSEIKFLTSLPSMIQELADEIYTLNDLSIDSSQEQKQYDKFMKKLHTNDIEGIKEDVNQLRDELSQLKEDKIKILQNQILDIQASVLANEAVKKMTVEKLDIETAREDAIFLEELNKGDSRYFTPLSDRYQKGKVGIGAVGKNGTAAYSLDVVSQSLFEQSLNNGKPVQLMQPVEMPNQYDDGTHIEYIPFEYSICGFTTDGILGNAKTLDGKRTIAEVNSERQNLMVDNEKEQIAARVHLNDYTMKVDKVFNMLGFDRANYRNEDGTLTPHSISFMFISQPIIKRFVKMMEAENSNTAEFNPRRKEDIIDTLLQEMGYETLEDVPSIPISMNNLVDQIADNGSSKAIQAAVLRDFLTLERYGIEITSVQTTLNVDSKGIGKNLMEAMEKMESIVKLSSNKRIDGASNLIGDYFVAEKKEEVAAKLKEGYVVVSVNDQTKTITMIKPTTISGMFAINGLVAANEIFSGFFPYKTKAIKKIFDEVTGIISNGEMKEAKAVEMKQLIFNDMKKYLYTDTSLDIFTDTVQNERKRLFFDVVKKVKNERGVDVEVPIHKSLARFLSELPKNASPEVKRLLKSNRLIARFQYEVNTTGKPSFIKFNNAAAENFDEQYLYNAIIELVEANVSLGQFNGVDYTSTDLAQDLVAYAYLEGGIQEAIQFVKYIPVTYLKAFGINNIEKDSNGQYFHSPERNSLGIKENGLSTFTVQFMQHHPGLAFKLTGEMMKDERFKAIKQTNKDDLGTLHSFTYGDNTKSFISIYNEKLPKGELKFQLYMLDSQEGVYKRVPVLGTFGMAEYMAGFSGYKSLVNQTKMIVQPIETGTEAERMQQRKINRFDTMSKDPQKILKAISLMDSPMGNLAKKLMPLVGSDLKFQIADMEDYGVYNGNNNTITISSQLLDSIASNEEVARTILKEVVHSISDNELRKYVRELPVKPDGTREFAFIEGSPTHIKNLVRIFGEVQKELNKDGALSKLMKKWDSEKNKWTEGLTDSEYNVTYAGTNIFEFIERIMTTPELQKALNGITYKETNMSLLDKIWEWLSDVLAEVQKTFKIDLNKDGITANTVANIFQMFEAKKQVMNDTNAEKTIDNVEDFLGSVAAKENESGLESLGTLGANENTTGLFDDDGNIIEDDLFDGDSFDPKKNPTFDKSSLVNSLLKSGSLTIKC